ncbi:crossover junction endodeoxyribonuclease RuvC [Clostridia bacterium]|nr:crossover junction endodeoxyribonuclease RuvC [Clostridia bacterium]
MRILGIDPGLATIGFGVIDNDGGKLRAVDYGAVLSPAGMPIPERLKMVYDDMTYVIQRFKPDEVSIEELFFNTNAKTAIMVGQARGVLVLAAANAGLPVFEYTPLQIKQAVVGYGRADKNQVQQMVKSILELSAVPKPDDVADAVAAAICHAHSSGIRSRILQSLKEAGK